MQNPNEETRSLSLPLRPIPGDYGLPFFGAIKDRYDYFYNQGRDEFFRAKMAKHKSTVFRSNMPPGPFVAKNPRVVVLLDAVSFPVLFDTAKVEKRDVFDGTFMPSVGFTGGYRVCSFLDPTEPRHTSLKSYFLHLLASRHRHFIPVLRSWLADLFANLESAVDGSKDKKGVEFNSLSDNAAFNFAFELFCGEKLSATKLGPDANKLVDKWLLPQVAPLVTLGLPKLLNFFEDLLLHTFPIPSLLVRSSYNKVYEAFYASARVSLDEAENRFGVGKEDACHNLVFLVGFNTYGGLKVLFPSLFKWVGAAGEALHRRLAEEIRTVVAKEGDVTFSALEKMPLTKSVVYEVLRIEPPVPFQYGHAREDLVVRSHDAAFEVKKGEMIFGFQPFATRDPRVFRAAEEFVADRFVGEEGERMLRYVMWSNGRETEAPTAENKQCPAKDFVVLVARVLLVEFFLRYDTFEVEDEVYLLGNKVTFKSLTKKKVA